ncbi:uncharacterized protein CEXT_335941 [Caerostris extrusa]|uniref:Uncharacterized protein n=1 Tax=Caerostris extrusa TaxID=172846 RepID=A0AAV4TZ40_CAEEX|nr:uncharacterized protein CEXT_335941 [Caerostris extrusa]
MHPIYADRDCCPIGWECGMTAKDHLISSSRVVVIDWSGLGCLKNISFASEWDMEKFLDIIRWLYHLNRFDVVFEESVKGLQNIDVIRDQMFFVIEEYRFVVLFEASVQKADLLQDCNIKQKSRYYGTQNPGQQLSKGPQCDCEWRYLKHYEAKGCRPVYEEKPQTDKPSCTCPWRFDCSQADEIHEDERVCLYKKHVYPIGSKIPTSNPCETCSCATDYFTQAATISCTTTECPAVYSQTPLPEGCHYVYKENQCCPTSVECLPACEYKGKMYYEGEQIYPEEDPCLICLCNQN